MSHAFLAFWRTPAAESIEFGMWLKSNKERCLLNFKSAWLNHSMCCTSCTAEIENKQSPYKTQPRSSLAKILKIQLRSSGVIFTVKYSLKWLVYMNPSYFLLLLIIHTPLLLKLKLWEMCLVGSLQPVATMLVIWVNILLQ